MAASANPPRPSTERIVPFRSPRTRSIEFHFGAGPVLALWLAPSGRPPRLAARRRRLGSPSYKSDIFNQLKWPGLGHKRSLACLLACSFARAQSVAKVASARIKPLASERESWPAAVAQNKPTQTHTLVEWRHGIVAFQANRPAWLPGLVREGWAPCVEGVRGKVARDSTV